jgi:uncharacterized protein YrrD
MPDLGEPISYKVLERRTPVFSSDGDEIGSVDHVLADEQTDVFDGIVIRRGASHAVVDADQVDTIHERGVTLNVSTAESEQFPTPGENPAVIRGNPAEDRESGVARKLRRAWDWVSGNY